MPQGKGCLTPALDMVTGKKNKTFFGIVCDWGRDCAMNKLKAHKWSWVVTATK